MAAARCYNRGMRKACVRWFAATAMTPCFLLVAADLSELSRIRSVYIWPMHNSFDQYLAEQIAEEDVFEVVVDPKFATAVLTDRIDAPFLGALEEFFPLPESGEAEKDNCESSQGKKLAIVQHALPILLHGRLLRVYRFEEPDISTKVSSVFRYSIVTP